MFSLVGAFHEVWCPDARWAGMQGSGTSKPSLDGKVDSPQYGGYTTHAVVNGTPPTEVIVVVVEYSSSSSRRRTRGRSSFVVEEISGTV